MKDFIGKSIRWGIRWAKGDGRDWDDRRMVLNARTLMSSDAWRCPHECSFGGLASKEFSVYSQFGDDGIIQYLLWRLQIHNGSFIEFGVGDYYESNTHFLLVNNNWRGFVMDGSDENMSKVRSSPIYWKYDLTAKQAFVDRDNVSELLAASGFDSVQLLHIDLDGNDYWILDVLALSELDPDILILEYNAHFGNSRAIAVPYRQDFDRLIAHYSGQYFGASLPALDSLARKKGYYFVGCNRAGNNAYFLANRHLGTFPEVSLSSGFVPAKFRDCRDEEGRLTFLSHIEARGLIKGMPVVNVDTAMSEVF